MDPEFAHRLDSASKLDRRPAFVESLINHGEDRADAFLAGLSS